MKKYFINTYGCQMNVHESEKIAGVLREFGFEATEKQEEANIIVFNTCCIREGAEQKIFANIGALKPRKKVDKDLIVAVIGCMTQQYDSARELKEKFPWIDIIIGTFNADLFGDFLSKVLDKRLKTFEILDKEMPVIENDKFYRTSGYNGWVNITYGCNNFCSYCIVPYVRGRERSRKSENIIKECQHLIDNGYKQITLLGQNVNSYGKDLEGELNFAKLCKSICELDGDFRLKFMTSHPKDFSDELIEVLATQKKMSKVVHLPVQSGSDRILKLMNRHYTSSQYREIINKLKNRLPEVVLTSDFIVGFPTETEEDFNETMNLVKDVRYNSIFAFMYSKRKGTVAEKMDGQIPDEIKHERVNKLLDLQHAITKETTQECLGKIFDCLLQIEGSGNIVVTDSGRTIEVDELNLKQNVYYRVKVDRVEINKLHGIIVD